MRKLNIKDYEWNIPVKNKSIEPIESKYIEIKNDHEEDTIRNLIMNKG
jgi:hypothetical protein